jgi:hypothetical protein
MLFLQREYDTIKLSNKLTTLIPIMSTKISIDSSAAPKIAAARAAKEEAKKAEKAEKKAEKAKKQQEKQLEKLEKQRKKQFQKAKKILDKKLCREIRYYQKEVDKVVFKCPGEEHQIAWTEKKCCSKCGQSKSLMVFGRNDTGAGNIIRGDGRRLRRPECMACRGRDEQSKKTAEECAKRLGISYKAPEGTVCRLCSKPGTKSNSLVFDHHHELDVFRGYCCNRCNIGMGTLGDNMSSMCAVVRYMNETEKFTKEQVIAMCGFD